MPAFSTVLRIFGRDFDVDAFVRRHQALAPVATWRIGEARLGGRKNVDSGLSLAVEDGASWIQRLPDLRVAGIALEALAADARRSGAAAELDIAMAVGGSSYTTSISLTSSQMEALARLGIVVTVSAYPVSDQDEDEGPSRSSTS
jgi:hypothetical protein